MTTELQTISFHGDELACIEKDGAAYVSVRHVCDGLSLNYPSQLTKLKGASWACVSIINTHDSSGRRQDIAMLPVKALPMWMVTIRPGKVAADIRSKLERYQIEAAEVLARHFLPDEKPALAYPSDPMTVQLLALADVRQRQLVLEAEEKAQWKAIDETRQVAESASTVAQQALDHVTRADGRCTVVGYANKLGIKLKYKADQGLGTMASNRCRKQGIETIKIHNEVWGIVGVYPLDILEGMKEEFYKRAEPPKLKAITAS